MVDTSGIRTDWQNVSEADWQVNNAKAQTNRIMAGPLNALGQAIIDLSQEVGGGGGVDIQVGGTQPSSGWWLDNGQPLPDTVAPSTPTGLTATATGGSTVDLSWSPSSDNIGVTGYHYRIGTGAAVDAGPGTTEAVSGLSALTAYSFQVRAYDAQGNVSGWSTAANATTLAGPDTTAPTPGTLAASAITSTTFTLTVTGASDNVALAATPYAFSTDNGSTWSAWQAGATHDVTGRTASTAYQARHKVRDAAGNEALGTAITVTTSAPEPIAADTFTRADTGPGGLGTTEVGGLAWVDPDTVFVISNNVAKLANTQSQKVARIEVGTPFVRVAYTAKVGGQNTQTGFLIANTPGVTKSGYFAEITAQSGSPVATLRCWANSDALVSLGTIWNPGSPTVIADGDVIEMTVTDTGTAHAVTLKHNGTTLTTMNFGQATRPTGTKVSIYGNNTNANGADAITVWAA